MYWLWIRRILAASVFVFLLLWILSVWARSPVIVEVESLDGEWLQHLRDTTASNNNSQTKVVIVGAGAAGLMAGYTLKYLGLSNITILEASSQWGGRTLEFTNLTSSSSSSSSSATGVPLDLGAEWLHYHPDILQDLLLFDNDDEKEKETSLLPETIVYRPETYRSRSGFSNWIRYFYTDYKFLNTTWYSYLKTFIYSHVANEVHTNSIVDTVDYSGPKSGSDNGGNQIQIILRDTDDVITADKVIVATPVSILQNRDITFIPTLPNDKWNAIDKVEFAPGLKVWLVFGTKFYDDWVLPQGIRELVNEDKLYFDALWGKGLEHGDDINQEHILTLFEVGDRAFDHIEMTDEEIVLNLLAELDTIYNDGEEEGRGEATKHYTGKYYVQNWSKQPFVQGAYSYNWNEIYDDVPTMQSAISKQIYFAGEYTVQDYPATVTGASLSGRRTALRLIEDLK